MERVLPPLLKNLKKKHKLYLLKKNNNIIEL